MRVLSLLVCAFLVAGMPPAAQHSSYDKLALWTNGTQLRGANIWQRVVVPELDGPDFLGGGHVGPPYSQADFDRLAALGANYVNVSHPGLFTQDPPYELDQLVQDNLDNLLAMIAQADMFAVVSFRTGPGRSDFTFYSDGAGVWFDESLLNDRVWEEQAAQDAWAAMWRYTAERYRDNPIVVGYDLMVEPNAPGALLDIYDPNEFYAQYANTLYDWNQLYPRIAAAIREVDPDTPVLIAAGGWSEVEWLPYIEPTGDPRSVYTAHQYAPHEYTHQETPTLAYPGEFDADYDGEADLVNRDWLDEHLSPLDDFAAQHGVPLAINEYGVKRWSPGAADFMADEMELFEERGVNYALWAFNPSWQPFQTNDAFDFLHGSDPDNHTGAQRSDLLDVVRSYWAQNVVRPSNVRMR